MADMTSPASSRRRSFLGKLFGKKDKHHNVNDATPPPYENSAQINHSSAADSTTEGNTANHIFRKAEEHIKEEQAKFKDHLRQAGEPRQSGNENSAEKYFAEAEGAAKKDGAKLEGDWKEAQRPESAEDKYGDLM